MYRLEQGDCVNDFRFGVESVSSTSRLVTTSFFLTTNSTVVTYSYEGDSPDTPRITVVEVGSDLSGCPKREFRTKPAISEWMITNVVVHGEWLVWGRSNMGESGEEFVGGVVYRLKEGAWIQQGNDIRFSAGEPFASIVMALSASSLYDNVEPPTVVVGFIFGPTPI